MTIRINRDKKELQLSVRDISFLGIPKSKKTQFAFKSAELGQEIHQKIQTQKLRENTNYETEYFVKYQLKVQGWQVVIRGRIDLIARTPKSVRIEEIKSIFLKQYTGSPDDPGIEPFKQQLQCYAWIFNQIEAGQPSLLLQLILVNRFDNAKYTIPVPYLDMSEFVIEKVKQILHAEKVQYIRLEKKIRSLSNLHFPFSYRKYQKDIILKIGEIIEKELFLIIEAPSGIGKTVVSLYPLISKVILEDTKLFFLTAKTTQRHIVEKTLNLFYHQGVDLLALTLRAKEKMCTNAIYFCHEDYCPFLRNYLQHFPDKILEKFILQRGVINPESIEREALDTEAFCPFELSLDISLEADVIIGDYNYVFHPRVSLQRFFGDPRQKKQLFYLVIDEAHNLLSRSLSYYSHTLTQGQVIDLKRSMRQLNKKVKGIPLPKFLPPKLERIFRNLRTDFNTSISTHILKEINIRSFNKILSQFEDEIIRYVHFLVEKELHWPDDPIISFYFHFRDFVETAALAQNAEEFAILYNSHEGKIKILCKDASPFLHQRVNFFKSSVAISATITPFPFYRDLLGFPIDKTVYKSYPSPFSPENRKILVIPDIDTRYKQRAYYYKDIAKIIQKVLEIKRGKYFAFFPSFEFVEKVANFLTPNTNLQILKQTSTMRESNRKDFINTIETTPHVLALAVTAGIFAEGIDFPGILDGVFVISPSLPAVNFEQEILKQYYEERYSNGFAYAYQFPGLRRTFQAAGRLIRTSSDRGIIIFIGRRFATPHYANHFPSYYYQESPRELITNDLERDVRLFWKQRDLIPINKKEE
ncbi:MAG: ATP-dependent DNA helicase [Candidatus Hodarchaeales archaeon]